MQFIHNHNLRQLNSFGIDCTAKWFSEATKINDIKSFLEKFSNKDSNVLILGGGSNVLFTSNFKGAILKIGLKGKEVFNETSDHIYIKAQAGEDWDEFVAYCVDNDWGGLENLSLIPGQVGSSPIQNIGAYGVELKDCLHRVEAIERKTGKVVVFSKSDCNFGYRDSFFKQEGRGKYVIVSVTFKFTKHYHKISISYGGIQKELEEMGLSEPTISDVRQAVISIRNSKLPDPKKIGNAGSFFKNPIISSEHYYFLKEKFSDLVAFEVDGQYKLAAGWLIDKAGWKGYREGDAGVHSQQALVLVNYGNATGNDILALARKIQDSILEKFGVELEMEVNVI
jgi:UDP-N-acetylmuramate dehydrogenase